MKMWTMTASKGLLLAILVGVATAKDPRSIEHLSKCITIAEPLVKDPKYIFPLNIQDIRDVCRMWEKFIECVYDYANTYMPVTQQQDFNKTIQSNIEVIQRLCVEDPSYQKIYMAYAPCMKRVSIDQSYCGNQYRYLTDIVQGRAVSDGKLCCAHRKFRECVLDTTASECDGGGLLMGVGNTPSQFMREMLDQTMGFLLQKCKDFVPNARDCPIFGTSASGGNSDALDRGAADEPAESNTLPQDLTTIGAPSKSPTPGALLPSTTPPTTRFTWTTRKATAVPITPRPTSSPAVDQNLNLAGAGFLGPASSQFKDAGTVMAPTFLTVILAVLLLFKL